MSSANGSHPSRHCQPEKIRRDGVGFSGPGSWLPSPIGLSILDGGWRRVGMNGRRRVTGLPERQGNTPHTARMAHDQALGKAMQRLLEDDTQVYKQFVENGIRARFVRSVSRGFYVAAQGPEGRGTAEVCPRLTPLLPEPPLPAPTRTSYSSHGISRSRWSGAPQPSPIVEPAECQRVTSGRMPSHGDDPPRMVGGHLGLIRPARPGAGSIGAYPVKARTYP
jgi:hypothetical protein